jgi:hypothetical protein
MKLSLFILLPVAALAHMVSMSTGELKVEGSRAEYELKMPSYEAQPVKDASRALLANIHFRSAGVEGKMLASSCSDQNGTYTCTASYLFPEPVEKVDVECTFASITVPNHIHMLRAYRGDKTDQAVFDLTYTKAELRFRPPEPWEIFVKESGAGFLRAAGGLAPLLFLLSLALAARSRPELLALAAAFLAGEIVACMLAPRLPFALSPRFIEAAAALTIAYLAFEILLLPQSGQRWLVVGALGLFHGAYFSLFLVTTGYHLGSFLTGVIAAELVVLSLFYLARRAASVRVVPVAATLLLTTGVVWFAVRVWS